MTNMLCVPVGPLQANCYLSKPVQLDEFESLVRSINDFWLTKVKLPQQIV